MLIRSTTIHKTKMLKRMNKSIYSAYTEEATALLMELIRTPSFSKEEDGTADIIVRFLEQKGLPYTRVGNNIISQQTINKGKPLLVLNSHHDTVRPCEGWTVDPFFPVFEEGKITGLGSNDAGGCLVSLLMTYVHYHQVELPYRITFIASAEEEISGSNGVNKVLATLEEKPSFAIVGEPTETQFAIAEKGLLVIDAYASGTASHAAHPNEDNAIHNALKDISIIESLHFSKVSELLGAVKLTVTQINAGKQHNVVPDLCHFVIDCRVNEYYSNQEVFAKIQSVVTARLTPRSTHLNSSKTPLDHSALRIGKEMGKQLYGSPTLSDQVFFSCPSIKVGPGDSTRSHQADEYIHTSEIQEGIETYINLLADLTL